MVERLSDEVGGKNANCSHRRARAPLCSKYTTLARAQDCFSSIVSDVWSRPKRLGRSASFTNLTYVREAQHDFPALKRTSSYSSLAPSLTLSPQYDRVAERIVHTAPVYRPFISDWYNKAYNVARFKVRNRACCRRVGRLQTPISSGYTP